MAASSRLADPRMRLFLFCFFAAALATAPAEAQNLSDYGSIYSRFGVGERLDFSTSQASMLGISGTAMRSGLYNGLSNPALGADQTLTTFTLGASVQGLRASDGQDRESRSTAGDLTGLQLGVPLTPGALGLTLSFRPYSRVNYRAVQDGTLFGLDNDTLTYRTNLEGSGGLQRLSAGLAGRVGRAVRIGASADAVFGRVEYIQRTEFPGNQASALETRSTTSTRVAGFTGTLGATVSTGRLARENDELTIGAALTLPVRLSGEAARTVGASLDQDTLSVSARGHMTLPLLAQAGFSYRASPRLTLAADALYEPWSRFQSDFAMGGFDPVTGTSSLQDRTRAGAGLEFVPGAGTRQTGIAAQTAYRVGGYAEQALYAPTDARLTTLAVTGGISIPTRFTATRFDLGLEAGTRGSTGGVLVRDVFVKGTATFNFGERWFVRRRLG